MSKTVALLMSGGVDSTVSASLLLQQGYSVCGVHMLLPGKKEAIQQSNWDKVKEYCSKLQIQCHLFDIRTQFEQQVIRYFIESYKAGFTPNPCVICNKTIKFGTVFEYATNTLHADFIASGHYARIKEKQGRYYIQEAADKSKDQAYFLFTLSSSVLEKVLFPLGEFTKEKVIQMAREKGVISESYKESEDLCFIAGHYAEFLSDHIPDISGKILDREGKVLGKHTGIHQFTVGQRQGLQVSSREPLYVLSLRPETGDIVVGTRKECYSSTIRISPIYHLQNADIEKRKHYFGRIRYRSQKIECTVSLKDNLASVSFIEPVFAVTPGQMFVLYEEDIVLGGGVIQSAEGV